MEERYARLGVIAKILRNKEDRERCVVLLISFYSSLFER